MTDPTARTAQPAGNRGRALSVAKIAVFDVGGPLAVYALLRSAGLSAVMALILSGILPAFGVLLTFARNRRLDAVGALVLLGILVGTVLGLASGSPRLVLLEGSVPTAVFGLFCLGSLASSRPLIYRFAVEFIGADSPRGREFESLWQYEGFRHVFQVMTIVWGIAYLAEAAARVVIVELTSTGSALAISKIMPYAVAAALAGWMWAYGQRSKRRGERMAAESEAESEAEASAQAGAAAQPAIATEAAPPPYVAGPPEQQ